MNHQDYLKYCVKIAINGIARTSPNPMVGSILVYKDKIVSEAWHERYGEYHAERIAINKLIQNNKSILKDCTLYISLEPCNHFGKTPPCTDLIIESGIRRIVFVDYDPNPQMTGKSIAYLKSNGVETIGPFPSIDCSLLIKSFQTNISKNRPYVILKWAQSSDHFLGVINETTKISNQYSNILVHKWRSEVDGILVGRITEVIDTPQLNTRYWTGKKPKSFVLTTGENVASVNKHSILIINSTTNLQDTLARIYENEKIGTLIIEGGGFTLQRFIDGDLWDEARVITNTKLKIKQGITAPIITGKLIEKYTLEEDQICVLLRQEG